MDEDNYEFSAKVAEDTSGHTPPDIRYIVWRADAKDGSPSWGGTLPMRKEWTDDPEFDAEKAGIEYAKNYVRGKVERA